MGSPWIRPRSLFSKIFNGLFIRMNPMIVLAKFEASPVPEIIAIVVLGFWVGVANPQSWEHEAVGDGLNSHTQRTTV